MRALSIGLLLAATCSIADPVIVHHVRSGQTWTNRTADLRVIDLSARGSPDVAEFRRAGVEPTRLPALVDTDARVWVHLTNTLQQGRADLLALIRDGRAPDRVREARQRLDAIGLQFGLTNERPARVMNLVLRTNTNAANAVLRAEAMHALWTIRDWKMAQRLGLADDGDEP